MATKKKSSKTGSSSNEVTSFEVNNKLHLVVQNIPRKVEAKPVETPTNHCVVIDCSGSMSSDLPKIRAQLKKKLPSLLKENDTFSMIWFSGRNEFGTLIEAEPVSTLKDLNAINNAIDRWLKPVGLTGFKDPIIEAEKLIDRVSKKNKNPFSLLFLSDGCDNCSTRPDILKAIENTGAKLASATFVEYGYYSDRILLSAMAEKCGGQLIFAEHFDKYEPLFEAAIQKQAIGGKKIEVKIEGDAILGIAFGLTDNAEILTFEVVKGKIHVPEKGISAVAYLSPTVVGSSDNLNAVAKSKGEDVKYGYAMLSLLATKMKPDIVYPILKAIGDVKLINDFANCYGKQAYTSFMECSKNATFDSKLRFVDGYDPTRVPPDDAFTVLDLIKIISEDDDNRILMDHPEFRYSRISRARLDADENLTADEQEKIDELSAKMKGEKSAKKLKDLQDEVNLILNSKKDGLKFVADPAPDGYSISSLTYNESRPNISLLIRKTGTVDISKRVPNTIKKVLPEQFPSFVFRNYAIVKDGLVNIEKLPVKLTKSTWDQLKKNGVEMVGNFDSAVIDVKKLPILNRKMVESISAKDMIELEFELASEKAKQKVFNFYVKDRGLEVNKSPGFEARYGTLAAEWLKENGFTDYSGFSPKKTVQADSVDFYIGRELNVKLKGYSTLPSVKDVKDKLDAKKPLSGPASLMAKAITDVEKFLAKSPAKLHEAWLTGQAKATTAMCRGLMHRVSQNVMVTVVGQSWMKEFKSLDENTFDHTVDGVPLSATFELADVEIKI